MKSMKRAFLSLVLAVASLLVSTLGFAETEKKPAKFGVYRQQVLDLEVKVSSGFIRVWRSWDGEKKQWTINPQHAPLTIKDPYYSEQYQRLVAAELQRGPRSFKGQSFYQLAAGTAQSGTSTSSSGDVADRQLVSASIAVLGIETCKANGDFGTGMVPTAQGYKYITGVGHEWAEYDAEGAFTNWGVGDQRVGTALYDNSKNLRGYANHDGAEVISIEKDNKGRPHIIRDHTGRTVTYEYNSDNLISQVTDSEGDITKYFYQNGNLTRVQVGDPSGLGGDNEDEGAVYTLSYYDQDRIRSVLDDEGFGTTYQHEYDKSSGTYIETKKSSGNKVSRTYANKLGETFKIENNDRPFFRVVKLCEDSAIIDQNNAVTYFDRDNYSRLRRIVFPNGNVASYEHSLEFWPNLDKPWDTAGKPWGVISYKSPSGRNVSYVRDTGGRILEATEDLENGEKRKWAFQYDSRGNRIFQRLIVGFAPDDENDFIDRWTYDGDGNLKTYTDANGITYRFKLNNLGLITEFIEPNGATWTFSYNGRGQLKHSKDPAGFEVFNLYNKRGLLREYRERYDSGKEAVYRYHYNRRGLLTKIVDPQQKIWTYQYDEAGELKESHDPLGNIKKWTYDRDGRVKSYTDQNDITITYEYFDMSSDGSVQTTAPFPPLIKVKYPTFTQELRYDLRKRLSSFTVKANNGEIQKTSYEYDGEDRVTRIVFPDNREVTRTYDKAGMLTSTSATGIGTTSVSHLRHGREVRYSHPLYGNYTQYFDKAGRLKEEQYAGGKKVSYQYNALTNELDSAINANGDRIGYQYDIAGRIKALNLFKGQSSVPQEVRKFAYNYRGDLLRQELGSNIITNEVDEFGRTIASTTDFGPFAKSHAYTYKANGDRDTYVGPDGSTYRYDWEPNGALQRIEISSEGSITYRYNKTDWLQPESILFPGGTNQTFQYDDLRRTKNIVSKDRQGKTLFSNLLTYAPSNTVPSTKTTEDGTYEYAWDSAKRLISYKGPGIASEDYKYDGLGRRSPKDSDWQYSTEGGVKDTGSVSYSYDSQGNRISKTAGSNQTKYNYTVGDRLTSIESPPGNEVAQYSYNASEQRVSKNFDGQKTYFYYDEDGLAGEFNSSGELIRSYIYNPTSGWAGEPLAMKVPNAGFQYFQNDSIGTPQRLVNKSGIVTWGANYSAFGEPNISVNTVTNPIRFPGQYQDIESGLYQNFFRDYDPGIGAYTSHDPYGILVTGFNRYGYAVGNPVTLTDPTGEILPVIAAVGYALFIVDLVYTGYQVYQCADMLINGCTADNMDSCQQALLSAGLGFGAGLTVKYGVPLIKKVPGLLGKLPEAVKPFIKRLKDEKGIFNLHGGKVPSGRPSPDQEALQRLVKEVSNKGKTTLSKEDAEILRDWAHEYDYPGFRAGADDLASPSNWTAKPVPHMHFPGAGGHIPVAPGIKEIVK